MLASARIARLATAGLDQQPLVVPLCFVFDGGSLVTAVDLKPKKTRELRRVRNIRQNPRVSLVVDRYDEDWTKLAWVIVEGHAAVASGDARRRALDALVAKYSQYAAMDLLDTAGDVLAITPTRILAWRAGD